MSGSTLVADHMEDLKFMVQEGQFLTCRSLATQYNLDINSSQIMLEEFFAASTGFRAIYMISGVVENFRRTFILATDEEVESAKKNFSNVTAVHIYSVQKEIPQNINTILSSTEMKHVQELMLESKSDDFLINNLALITSLDIKLLPNGQRIAPSENSSLQKSNSNDIRPAESLPSLASSTASKSRPTTSQNFFNAKSNTSAKNKEDITTENSAVPVKSSTPTTNADASFSVNQDATPVITITGSKDGDDAEWDDGSGHQTKPKLKTKPIAVKKQVAATAKEAAPTPPSLRLTLQRNQLSNAAIAALEDEEDTDDSEEEGEENQENGDETTLKVENPVVVGAMDDFTTTTGNGNPGKRKTKILVEKTFADERGYLVTEMVLEEVEVDGNKTSSDNSHAITSTQSSTTKSPTVVDSGNHDEGSLADSTTTTRKSTLIPSKSNSKKKVVPKSAAVESTTTTAPQQKSISSFFMRK